MRFHSLTRCLVFVDDIVPKCLTWMKLAFLAAARFYPLMQGLTSCESPPPPPPTAPACSNGVPGVEADGVCCVAECETCGGAGCRNRARAVGLTSDDCCVQRISDSGVYCDDSETAPCIVRDGECLFSTYLDTAICFFGIPQLKIPLTSKPLHTTHDPWMMDLLCKTLKTPWYAVARKSKVTSLQHVNIGRRHVRSRVCK